MKQTMLLEITTAEPDSHFTYATNGGFTQMCPCGCGVLGTGFHDVKDPSNKFPRYLAVE